jgi:hypothetical protein
MENMKHLMLIVCVLLAACFSGCGGGGSSSNPTAPTNSLQIVGISPTGGGPGTEVSVQGRGFGSVQGNNTISYAGATLPVSYWSDTMIKAVLPSNPAANGTFQVVINGVVSNPSSPFTVNNPIITGISPSSGGPTTPITLTGQFFGSSAGTGGYVSFNGQPATVISWTNTQITVSAPNPTNSQQVSYAVVVVLDGNRSSNAVTFNLSIPQITSVSPTTTNIGATVTLMGSGFGTSQSLGNGTVSVGGMTAQILSWSETQIQIKVPSLTSASSYYVIVTVNSRQSSPYALIISGPLITLISPNKLEKDKTATISGQYFGRTSQEGPGTIQMRNQDNSGWITVSPSYWSDQQIQFICPIGNYLLGTENREITITVGGLSTTQIAVVD